MSRVDDRLRRLDRSASTVTRGFGIFGRGVDRAGRSLSRVSRGAASAILSFIGLRGAVLAASGGFLGGAGLVYAMQKAIGVAINVEEQINKVGVVFGQSAGQIIDWSKTTATGIGLARSAALEAVGTFGNMLRPLGILPKQAAVMSKSLVNLAGDMSSFNNASLEDTLIAIRAGLAGEVEPLRRFGVFLSEVRLKAEAIRSGFVNKGFKGVLDPLVKSLSAYNLILKDSKLAQGDYARTANSTANVLRTVKAQVTDLAGVFGSGLEPVVNRVGRALRDKLADPAFIARVQLLGTLIGEKLVSSGKKVVDWFQANWGQIQDGFRTTVRIVRSVVRAITFMAETFEKLQTQITRPMRVMLSVWEKFLAIVSGTANAFSWVPGVGGKLKATAKKVDELRETLRALNRTLDGTASKADNAASSLRGIPAGLQTGRGGSAPGSGGASTFTPLSTAEPLQTSASKPKGSKSVVENILPPALRLEMAMAELTERTNDDLAVLRRVETYLDTRIRAEKKVERRIELLQELKSTRDDIADLMARPEDRTRTTTLFGGPFLGGEAFGIASSFGYKARPRDLLRDLRSTNAQLTILTRSATRLRKRGAPQALISDILAGGLENADEAATLAGASPKILRQYIKAFGNRERLEERVQVMSVQSQSVTVNAENVTVKGLRGDKGGDTTHRRTSTRGGIRRGAAR